MVVLLTIFSPDTTSLALSSDSHPCTSRRGVCAGNYVCVPSKVLPGAQLQSDSAHKETEVGGQLSVFSLRSGLSVTDCI